MKVYLVGNQPSYMKTFDDSFIRVETIKECDIMIFPGGPDVCPKYYNETPHRKTSTSPLRCKDHVEEMLRGIEQGKLLVGICGGAQLLTVGAGGSLVQHITGHAIGGTHGVTVDGIEYQATSSHHQMMYPYEVNHDMLGLSTEKRSTEYWKNDEDMYDLTEDVEVVWYPEIRALAIQPHPEWQVGSPFWLKCNELIKKYGTGDNT
jgi:gamma-glutamyl-gamma-aminobutyrate hydrolase PuuD